MTNKQAFLCDFKNNRWSILKHPGAVRGPPGLSQASVQATLWVPSETILGEFPKPPLRDTFD